jgi:WG containing repeat
LFALLNGEGRVIVSPRYEDIGWRAHQFPLLVKERGRFAHINESGTPISAERWSEAGMFYNNLAFVMHDGKCGYIGPNGAIAIPLAFDECGNFWSADAAIVRRGDVYTLIDRSGKILKDGLEEIAAPAEDGNPIAVRVSGKWGAIDHKGDFRIPPTFEALEPLDIFGDLLPVVPVGRTTIAYRAKRDGKVGLLGLDGAWILPPVYDEIDNDYNGDGKLASFRDGDKWGFVDLETRKATPASWDQVNSKHRAGLIPVRTGPHWGYVDRDGNMVIPPRYDEVREFAGDWAGVAVGERWGFIDSRGTQIAPLIFRNVNEYTAKRARIILFESRGWLTRQGRLLGISDDDLKRAGLKN